MLKPDNSILVFATIQILPQVLSVILVILAKSYNKDQANTWQLFNISFVFKIQSKHSDWIIALIHTDHFGHGQTRWKSARLNTIALKRFCHSSVCLIIQTQNAYIFFFYAQTLKKASANMWTLQSFCKGN